MNLGGFGRLKCSRQVPAVCFVEAFLEGTSQALVTNFDGLIEGGD